MNRGDTRSNHRYSEALAHYCIHMAAIDLCCTSLRHRDYVNYEHICREQRLSTRSSEVLSSALERALWLLGICESVFTEEGSFIGVRRVDNLDLSTEYEACALVFRQINPSTPLELLQLKGLCLFIKCRTLLVKTLQSHSDISIRGLGTIVNISAIIGRTTTISISGPKEMITNLECMAGALRKDLTLYSTIALGALLQGCLLEITTLAQFLQCRLSLTNAGYAKFMISFAGLKSSYDKLAHFYSTIPTTFHSPDIVPNPNMPVFVLWMSRCIKWLDRTYREVFEETIFRGMFLMSDRDFVNNFLSRKPLDLPIYGACKSVTPESSDIVSESSDFVIDFFRKVGPYFRFVSLMIVTSDVDVEKRRAPVWKGIAIDSSSSSSSAESSQADHQPSAVLNPQILSGLDTQGTQAGRRVSWAPLFVRTIYRRSADSDVTAVSPVTNNSSPSATFAINTDGNELSQRRRPPLSSSVSVGALSMATAGGRERDTVVGFRDNRTTIVANSSSSNIQATIGDAAAMILTYGPNMTSHQPAPPQITAIVLATDKTTSATTAQIIKAKEVEANMSKSPLSPRNLQRRGSINRCNSLDDVVSPLKLSDSNALGNSPVHRLNKPSFSRIPLVASFLNLNRSVAGRGPETDEKYTERLSLSPSFSASPVSVSPSMQPPQSTQTLSQPSRTASTISNTSSHIVTKEGPGVAYLASKESRASTTSFSSPSPSISATESHSAAKEREFMEIQKWRWLQNAGATVASATHTVDDEAAFNVICWGHVLRAIERHNSSTATSMNSSISHRRGRSGVKPQRSKSHPSSAIRNSVDPRMSGPVGENHFDQSGLACQEYMHFRVTVAKSRATEMQDEVDQEEVRPRGGGAGNNDVGAGTFAGNISPCIIPRPSLYEEVYVGVTELADPTVDACESTDIALLVCVAFGQNEADISRDVSFEELDGVIKRALMLTKRSIAGDSLFLSMN